MYYIGYYTKPDDRRLSSPAANAKILSISRALAHNGVDVSILSTCTVAKGTGWIRGRVFQVFEGVFCRQYGLYAAGFGPLRRLQFYAANLRLFFTLLFKTKQNENVLFYHAIERGRAVLLAKRIKKFRLILEVEEIYADALSLSEREKKIEQRVLSAADAYIFPTELLNQKVNVRSKPYVLIHGTYQCEQDRQVSFADDKIHVVYAGTLDEKKGGAWAALGAAEYLPNNYALHILGFGTNDQMEKMKTEAERMNQKGECEVSFEGTLNGEEYIRFIQKCHIGLSTQNPEADYNDTSFPSKILSYMANGLQVVSVRIPAVETSAVGPYMAYYDEQTPQEIADAIINVDLSNCDSRGVIQALGQAFISDICCVI